jgi:NAD(P)-dependent dehydrogenase (short-subunit alcohol dehydrogenase family)
MSLKDKDVVVTGGSRGLGLGLVEALVAHGARVTVVARETDALQSVRAQGSRLGHLREHALHERGIAIDTARPQ